MVYSGKEDYICNYMGGYEWTNITQWKGQAEFQKASLMDWKLPSGGTAGQARSGGGLTFVEVEGAGHMVPMDQPEAVSVCGWVGVWVCTHGSARCCECVWVCVPMYQPEAVSVCVGGYPWISQKLCVCG